MWANTIIRFLSYLSLHNAKSYVLHALNTSRQMDIYTNLFCYNGYNVFIYINFVLHILIHILVFFNFLLVGWFDLTKKFLVNVLPK